MEWISVKEKDRLPEEDERILITDGNIVFEGLIGWFRNNEPIWCNTEYIDFNNVTHWMPLPKPPNDIGIGSVESVLPSDHIADSFRYTTLRNKNE